MRILFISNNDAGLYKFRRELLETLTKEHEVYYCTSSGEYVERINAIGCKHIECTLLDRHGKNPLKDMSLIRFYKKVLRDIKPDIVFTFTIKPNCYAGMACASLHIPYVANITGLGTAVENKSLFQPIAKRLYQKGIKSAQKVFFQNSENYKFMAQNGMIHDRYDIIPGSGVNLKQFEESPYPKDTVIRFVFVGRIMREKGIDQYLDAAKAIKAKHPNTEFHICGSYEQQYKDTVERLHGENVIIYHGSVGNMVEIYRMVSCTIHPSFYPEGMSNVLLESCACGRPIITTDRPGCREIVDDGVNGFVVKQRDSADLIEKVERFLSLRPEEREKMGMLARKKVEREFDRQIIVDKYIQELESVGKKQCAER